MKTDERARRGLPAHGYAGLAVIVAAEALLFAGNDTVGHWFTPIVWTGYVLFVDALVFRREGRSLMMTNRAELLVVCVSSIAAWWLFEFYNSPRFWKNDLELWWHYHNLEPNPYLRRVGYDWAFATIFPALFETAELFAATLRLKPLDEPRVRVESASRRPPKSLLYLLIFVGAICALVPLFAVNVWLVPVVWLGLALLFDPLNALRGWQSVTADLFRGRLRRLASLALSGVACGVLWEFWNYWAVSRWTYTVPYQLFGLKLFEMPVLGSLGYPPFAVECWAIYVFFRSLLGARPVGASSSREREIVVDLQ
ncbi:MAG: hypothetical protein LC746_02605 [Acidobacteria bacterium]|nr:hypothetical protein [Acidobacteriota bacterium]